jgi:hypothetical protein
MFTATGEFAAGVKTSGVGVTDRVEGGIRAFYLNMDMPVGERGAQVWDA